MTDEQQGNETPAEKGLPRPPPAVLVDWMPPEEADELCPRKSRTLTDNRIFGKALWHRVRIEGMTLADAYLSLRPNAQTSHRSASQTASRWIRWFEARFPYSISEALEAAGINILEMAKELKKLTEAKRQIWDEEAKDYKESKMPDPHVHLKAWELVLKLVRIETLEHGKFNAHKERKNQLLFPPSFKTMEEFEAAAKEILSKDNLERDRQMQARRTHEQITGGAAGPALTR